MLHRLGRLLFLRLLGGLLRGTLLLLAESHLSFGSSVVLEMLKVMSTMVAASLCLRAYIYLQEEMLLERYWHWDLSLEELWKMLLYGPYWDQMFKPAAFGYLGNVGASNERKGSDTRRHSGGIYAPDSSIIDRGVDLQHNTTSTRCRM